MIELIDIVCFVTTFVMGLIGMYLIGFIQGVKYKKVMKQWVKI